MQNSKSSPSFNTLSQACRLLVEQLIAGGLPLADRVKAGNALAALGDPRFSAGHWYLPKEPSLGFVEIAGGDYAMGEQGHRIEMPTYYLARYHTTVAQFRAFVEDSGFAPGHPDCLRGLDNHPVVWVSWYEAIAYTRWLDEKLGAHARTLVAGGELDTDQVAMWSGLADGSLRVTLPSEAEWEKAARGAGSASAGNSFPWGTEIDTTRANYKESGLNTTTAVGSFPEGASPGGLLDMSGNAWNWLRTVWGVDIDQPAYADAYDADDGRENLDAPKDMLRSMRGGAFTVEEARAKLTFRDAVEPEGRDDADGFRVVITPQV